jgi:FKBP-type peptidyl-prolyl cis-trans isomerase SlyD
MVSNSMNIAKDRVVSIDYTLKNAQGTVLDSSGNAGPLSYLHGSNNIIPGLENALEGKNEGDSLTAVIAPADAYGERDERLVVNVPRDRFQGVQDIKPGMQFQAETSAGPQLVTVSAVSEDMVTIDGNHPLAGEELHFDVNVVAIRAASEEELTHGHPHVEGSHGGCGCGSCGDEGCGDDGCGGDCDCGDEGCGDDCDCNH